MKISYNWLKNFLDMSSVTEHGVPTPEELVDLLNAGGVDVEGLNHLYAKDGIVTEDDAVIDVRVSREMSGYASMMWTALELCGVFGIHYMDGVKYGKWFPDDRWERGVSDDSEMTITSTTEKCGMLIGRIIGRVKVKPSPDFIRNAVAANGVAPAFNLKDIPVYSARFMGQPQYIVDYDKLGSRQLVAMESDHDGVVVFEGKEYAYKTGDLVITNGSKVISIGGIMVDDSVAVDENTSSVVAFTGVFDADTVRELISRLDLNTFNGAMIALESVPATVMKGIRQLTSLIYQYAEGKKIDGLEIYNKYDLSKTILGSTAGQISNYLSADVSYADIVSCCVPGNLSFFTIDKIYDEKGNLITVNVCEPSPHVGKHIRFGDKFGSYRNRRQPCDLAMSVLCFSGVDKICSVDI